MKKTYLKPTIKSIKIKLEKHIMEYSGGVNNNKSGNDDLAKEEYEDFDW